MKIHLYCRYAFYNYNTELFVDDGYTNNKCVLQCSSTILFCLTTRVHVDVSNDIMLVARMNVVRGEYLSIRNNIL